MWLLPDPDISPVYVFADPFQHSGIFSTPPSERRKNKARYRWESPLEAQMVALTTNCRNSSPIANVAARFYPHAGPTAIVDGPPPVFHRVAPSRVLSETFSLAEKLVSREGLTPWQRGRRRERERGRRSRPPAESVRSCGSMRRRRCAGCASTVPANTRAGTGDEVELGLEGVVERLEDLPKRLEEAL